jgi:hypothetical protein
MFLVKVPKYKINKGWAGTGQRRHLRALRVLWIRPLRACNTRSDWACRRLARRFDKRSGNGASGFITHPSKHCAQQIRSLAQACAWAPLKWTWAAPPQTQGRHPLQEQ